MNFYHFPYYHSQSSQSLFLLKTWTTKKTGGGVDSSCNVENFECILSSIDRTTQPLKYVLIRNNPERNKHYHDNVAPYDK